MLTISYAGCLDLTSVGLTSAQSTVEMWVAAFWDR